ncbi:uncharacterized protein LOC130628984 [Hydractinia symbiolongicarpus]|uniref:uncharacterized protein LOC130628984 n=1 Tax=Hydractinia symbiolongicarpus TaxID=13093 RepID=UPI00254DAF2A|nr:uncharacterized protein LOC130628984 [Hydractinia symbiolongicarpus]
MIIIGSFCLCGSIILDIVCVWLITVKKHFRARDCCVMVSALWKILTVVIGTYSLCEIKFVVGKILYESGQSMWKDWLQMGFGPSSIMMAVGLSFSVLSILIHFFIILTSSSQLVYRERPCRREHRTRNQSRTRSLFNFLPTLPPYSPPPPEYSSKPATPAAVNPENNSGEVHIIENNSHVVSNANTQIESDTAPTVVNIGDVTVPNVVEETRSEPTGQVTPNAEPTNFVF